jgi:taspase, threonine aspartase, 1
MASKAVDRMWDAEDEYEALETCIERDFMGLSIYYVPIYQIVLLISFTGSAAVRESIASSAVGVLAVKIDRSASNKIRVLYGHTTDSMVYIKCPLYKPC